MSQEVVKLNNKVVQLSKPYRAPVSDIVGREDEMRKILAAWMAGGHILPLAPLLQGDPGLGKNRIVYECARACRKDLYIYQGHEDVSAEDLICAVRFSDDPKKKMDYILSPLVTATMQGGICFIDEIAKIRARALAPLVSLLDERRYLDSSLLGERIYAHPGFRFVAATNPADLDENQFPDFMQSRMRPVIRVGHPSREEIDSVVTSRYPTLSEKSAPLLDRFWELWHHRNGEKPPTPRDSVYIFGFAQQLADYEAADHGGHILLETHKVSSPPTIEHIEQAFDVFHIDYGRAA